LKILNVVSVLPWDHDVLDQYRRAAAYVDRILRGD